MRALVLRAVTLAAVGLSAAPLCTVASAQTRRDPRSLAIAVEPITPTRIESLLAAENRVLVADYYRIDMRFGPNLRIDAVIVEDVDSRTRVKGVRVQVRDPENRSHQDGTSFIDIEELIQLSHGLASMEELAGKWMNDERQTTESTFTTAGGFRLAIRQSARIPRVYLSTGLIDPVITSMDLPELPSLRQGFDQALALLNRK